MARPKQTEEWVRSQGGFAHPTEGINTVEDAEAHAARAEAMQQDRENQDLGDVEDEE